MVVKRIPNARRGAIVHAEPGAQVRPKARTLPRPSRCWPSDRGQKIVEVDPDLLAKLRASAIDRESTKIAVIVPVLARPARVKPLIESFHAATDPEDAAIYFIAQRSDIAELAELERNGVTSILVGDDERSWAKKINRGYAETKEPWLLLGADDLYFRPGWVDAVRQLLVHHCGVIGTNDMGNPTVMAGKHSTHPLVYRPYADLFGTMDQTGVVVHDGYDHNYPDTELVMTAKARRLYVHCGACMIEHLHPAWGKAKMDAVYELGNKHMQSDHRLFLQRGRRFGW